MSSSRAGAVCSRSRRSRKPSKRCAPSSPIGRRTRGRRANDASDHVQVSCHCTLPDDLPMARVHAIITALEGEFKLSTPEVDRLLIHPKPATDNSR